MASDFSEGSGPSSFSTASVLATSTTPPALDETLNQPQLFYAFLRFLMTHKAQENLVFMKHVNLFTLLKRPLKEKFLAASKIIWTFLLESSPNPVNLSAETLKKLTPVVWDRNGIALVKQDMFTDAFNEVKMMINPLFSEWIATNEWTHFPFFHAQPPTMTVIIKIPSLRSRFEAFLKARAESDETKSENTNLEYQMFKSACDLYEILAESNNPEASSRESERKARHYVRSHKAELASYPQMDGVEMPQSLHHKKKQQSLDTTPGPLSPDDSSQDLKSLDSGPSCLDFVGETFDVLAEELTERECYELFLEERSWDPIEVMEASLQQSHDKDGNVEYPKLAAILHSPTYGPLLANTFKDTEKFEQMRFLIEAHQFYAQFRDSMNKRHRTRDRKDMINEARRIFDRFISKNTIGLTKSLKNEISTCVFSFASNKLTPLVFQRAGAWIFNRISRSWIREVNTLLLWADHDFDNHSQIVLEMEQLYNIAHIPGLDLKLIPHPDDVVGNPDLWDSFKKFVPTSDINTRCLEFVRSARNLSNIKPENLMAEVQSLVEQLKSIAKDIPDLAPIQAEIEAHAINLRTFNPASFAMPCHMVLKLLLEQYYTLWTLKCKSAYRKGNWTAVPSLTFFGNESISGTSCIPSIGMSASVSGKTPSAASAGSKDKKRWGFSPFSKPKVPPSPTSGSASPTTPSSSSGSSSARKASTSSGSFSPVIGKSGSPSGSSENLLCKPRDTSVSDDESLYTSHASSSGNSSSNQTPNPQPISFRLPSKVLKNAPKFTLEVPTLVETLSSTHLRRLFYGTFLEFRLGDEEKKLWNALCKFHATYATLTDAEVTSRQKEICEAAMKLMTDFPQIPSRDGLMKNIAESRYTATCHFFYEAESRLYSSFYSNYQSFLVNNHWVMHPPGTPGSTNSSPRHA